MVVARRLAVKVLSSGTSCLAACKRRTRSDTESLRPRAEQVSAGGAGRRFVLSLIGEQDRVDVAGLTGEDGVDDSDLKETSTGEGNQRDSP